MGPPQNVAGGWTWVINPTTVNQFGTQYLSYTHGMIYPACPAPRVYLGVDLGVNACLPGRLNFPSVSTGPTYGGAYPLWTDLDNKLEFRDDLSKQIGRHAFKGGVYYVMQPIFGGIFGGISPGLILFNDDPSVIANNKNGLYPQGFNTPTATLVGQTSQTIGDYSSAEKSFTFCQQHITADCAQNDFGSGNFNFSTYFQDDFKASARVTLNLGLRYDVYDYIGTKRLPLNRTYQALQAIGSPYGRLPKIDKNNWQPRLGAAWDVRGDGHDVLRASWGLFYAQGLQQVYYQRNYASQPILQTTAYTFIPNYVHGVTPLPAPVAAPTVFPPGAGNTGYWYDPDLQDQQSQQSHVGWSHAFPKETVLTIDYTHVRNKHGWRNIDVNPILSNGVRPLSAATKAILGDADFFGPVLLAASLNGSTYNEMAVHFERRLSSTSSFQVNYTLAKAFAEGGETDWGYADAFTQTPSATGGDFKAPWESGPTAYDERHRLTVAGILSLPYGFDVSPAFTIGSPRPYTQYRGPQSAVGNQGNFQILCPSGNTGDVGFGAGQVPCGLNNARGNTLVNFNARVTKNVSLSADRKLSLFAEFFNILNRANFGTNYGKFLGTASYGQPVGYLGGIAATSTVPISFQVQFGARVSF